MIMIKKLIVRRISSDLIGGLPTLQLHRNLIMHFTLSILKCLRIKNVFKIVLSVSIEFAALSEYGSLLQRHGAT